MEHIETERFILERYRRKCAAAGGAREGYVLRRRAIAPPDGAPPAAEVDAALASLVEKGLLAASERRDLFFLTGAGVEALARLAAA